MGSQPLLHPTEQTLSDFSLGKLDDGQAEIINNHLDECSDCQRLVAEMSSDSFLGRLRGAQGPPLGLKSSTEPPMMSDEPAYNIKAGTLPPDLADHPDYQIVRELGRGGMGVVYLAHNRLMGRDEVLKVVGKHLIERKGVLERFSREIRSAARLMHPNIVHAYSAFRCGESIVFAMEYVDGLDLAKLVKSRGPLSVTHASYFVHQAALGLQHAHEQGMVHRDIKPGNLMLAHKGDKSTIKVLDFGLAKATRESPLEGALTHEGQMLGTPDFIAPEQIRDAQSAGIQADIYSLGCTLYYLLTGGPPFEAASLYDLLQAHFSMDAQPLNLVRPEVPAELAALVAKMMAKDAGRRFQTPAEVAEALKPFFKKAGANSKPDVSTLEQPGARPAKVQNVSTVTEPVTGTPRQPMKPAQSSSLPAESQLPTLGEFKEAEHSGDVGTVVPAVGSGGRPRWKPSPVAAAAGALGLLVLGVIIIIITNKGRLTVDTVSGNSTITFQDLDQQSAGSAARAETGKTTTTVAETTDVHGGVTPPPTELAGPRASDPPLPAAKSPATAKAVVSAADVKPLSVRKNSTGMKFALIPGGEFMMGSPDDDKLGGDDERPQHGVRISPFYLGIYEVTQAQYRAVIGNNPSHFSATGGGKDRVAGRSTDNYPVEMVSWVDAALFCNTLSEMEGRTPFYKENAQVGPKSTKGPGYRLPTEAEWEYACRAGTTTRYHFGDDAWVLSKYAGPSGGTHPVGEGHPNNFGLYEMHGNVWEWCSDWFERPYSREAPQNDPQGPSVATKKVFRGGCFDSSPNDCRSARRDRDPVERRFFGLGFRAALGHNTELESLSVNDRPGRTEAVETKPALPPGDIKSGGALAGSPKTDAAGDQRADLAIGQPKGIKPPPVFTNSINMKLALIPADEFNMGSPDSDLWAEANEKPQHRVRIAQRFLLGVHEVTQREYRTVTAESPGSHGGDDLPVHNVSWKDAVEFCNALSEMEGRKPYYRFKAGLQVGGDGYRLPMEAEWEYACRAGSTARYFFGDNSRDLDVYAWTAANSGHKPHPVGNKWPNAFGLYDMLGNVSEFCGDAFLADSYAKPQLLGTLDQSLTSDRVIRGGGYTSQPRECRSATRERRGPDLRRHDNMALWYGFRIARDFRSGDTQGLRTGSPSSPTSKSPVAQEGAGGSNSTAAKNPAGLTVFSSPLPPAAEGSPEAVLRKHGLTQSGPYVIVVSEAEILEKFEKVKPLIASMAQPFKMFAQALSIDMLLADAEEYHNEMRAQVDTANAILSKMPNGPRANSEEKLEYQMAEGAVNRLAQERDSASRMVEARRAQQIPAGRKEQLVNDFKAKWSDFLKAADELSPLIERTLGEYRKLQDDPAVKDALAAFRRSTKATSLLGPSKNLQNALDTIKNARRTYAPETAAPKKKTRPAHAPATAAPKKKGQAAKG